MDSESRIAVVKSKLQNYLSLTDEEVILSLAEIEQTIKNYTNRAEVPLELHFVWCRMTIDLLRYDLESNTTPSDVFSSFDPADVQTINIGDTSITFGDKYRNNQRSRILQSHQAKLDDVVMNYKAQLNQFRRLL